MRGYDCHYYYMTSNKELVKNSNSACWAGINNTPYIKKGKVIKNTIYIERFENEVIVNNKHIVRLVNLINNITPCKIVSIKKVKYIKFKLLGTYDQNLIVLNFIRQLWYECFTLFDSISFFDELKKTKRKKEVDSLYFIMSIFKKHVIWDKESYTSGHSNFIKGIKPKKTSDLLKYKGNSVAKFLIKK